MLALAAAASPLIETAKSLPGCSRPAPDGAKGLDSEKSPAEVQVLPEEASRAKASTGSESKDAVEKEPREKKRAAAAASKEQKEQPSTPQKKKKKEKS